MRKIVRLIKIMLVAGCIITGFSIGHGSLSAADNYDFENNEDYYYELCSGSGLTADEKTACRLFRDYLTAKQDDINKQMEDLEANIKEMKANIVAEGRKLNQYNKMIDSLNSQITAISRSITRIEGNIEVLNQQIALREAKIEQMDTEIKNAMVVYQTNLRTNSFISFIMGATSFVDLLRRINAINTIASYTQKKIDEMNAEKVLLQNDLNELQEQKDELIVEQNDLKVKTKSLEKLKAMTEELIKEFEKQEATLEDAWDELDNSYEDLEKVIDNIDKALREIVPSSDLGLFVHNKRIYISSGCYYYSVTSGGFHAAIDVASLGYSTPIYAVANGYVFVAKSGCPYNGGYLGNNCNSGRGNHVGIIFEIKGKIYCAYYYHMSSVNVAVGDLVYKDKTVVGISGNSGNSSGPHLHFALYYLGDTNKTSIQKLLNVYKTKGIRFGITNNITGSCPYRGNQPPCFMNPMEVYGYYWHNWYYVSY